MTDKNTKKNPAAVNLLAEEFEHYAGGKASQAGAHLASWIKKEDNVGDLVSIDYDACTILVHDHLRQEVGGLPLGCFLLATRIIPSSSPSGEEEDTSLILLRVTGTASLPNARDLGRVDI